MTLSLLKTTAVAGAMLAASTVGSFAATYAYVDHDALVRYNHSTSSIVVNDVSEGDYVKIIGHWGNWYKIKIDGPDGWVKASVLDFDSYDPYPGPGPSPVQACFWGPLGYVCVNP
jgi:SH3-like domain-containing protein